MWCLSQVSLIRDSVDVDNRSKRRGHLHEDFRETLLSNLARVTSGAAADVG
jgi:hypothetical protein